PAAPAHLPLALVDLQVGVVDQADGAADPGALPAGGVPPGAAEQRADPGDQRLDRERLGDVVVAAQREPGDGVGGGVPRGEVDDRDVVAPAAQLAADLETADVGEQHVQQDQVRPLLAGAVQSGGAVPRRADREAVEAQGSADEVPD